MEQILSTLKELLAIAAHPIAMVGFLAVIAAWTLSYFRTARFQLLMEKIAALPEADAYWGAPVASGIRGSAEWRFF
jgi:hypothetical protein